MTIQPIPTRFAGYHFRSRLEARWMLFLLEMGTEPKYEPEGYSLPEGLYLPDFFIPAQTKPAGWGYWLEVKGEPPTQHEQDLMRSLCLATGHIGYIVWGLPGENEPMRFGRKAAPAVTPEAQAAMEFISSTLPVPNMDAFENAHFWTETLPFFFLARRSKSSSEYAKAVIAAKSARFEHGEKPFRTPSG